MILAAQEKIEERTLRSNNTKSQKKQPTTPVAQVSKGKARPLLELYMIVFGSLMKFALRCISPAKNGLFLLGNVLKLGRWKVHAVLKFLKELKLLPALTKVNPF